MALDFLRRLSGKAGTKQAQHLLTLTEKAALALQEAKFETAIELYDLIIEQNCDNAMTFYKRGNAHNGLGWWKKALDDYDHAIALDPTYAYAHCNRGAVLERLDRWDDALRSYDRALELDPGDYLACYNRGSALRSLKRFEDALKSYDRAVELNKNYVPVFVNRGNVLQKLRRFDAAIESYNRAIGLDASIAEAYMGRGVSLASLRRFPAALASYDHAIQLKGDYVEAYSNRGNALQEMADDEAALASYGKCIERDPRFAAALHGQAFSFQRLGNLDRAIQSFDEALAVEPEREYLRGMRLHARMQVCDWTNLAMELKELTTRLWARKRVSSPLPVLALVDSPALHRLVGEIWAENESQSDEANGDRPTSRDNDKIRVGYFSSDFCEHAVSFVTARLFEMHDRTRFEITAFAFGPRLNDPMRARLQRTFDRFVDVRDKSDMEVARLARSLGIDIAVDLGGYTEYSRKNIFALRAAPIQVNYLGYPGTMGAEYMDYLVADTTVVPEETQKHFTEKIIYLPHSYMPSDSSRPIAIREFKREELGLPSTGFVFCCFNNSYKIVPSVFACWMRILNRLDGSVLWLAQNNPATARNLRLEASRHGVVAGRLVFANRISSHADHLGRLGAADLFLDTLPYNAHATAVDALWAGLPVITRRGESFTARVAASLLGAVGLRELITTTVDEYEDLAVRLASNPTSLADIRAKLRKNRLNAALFDTKSYAAYLESAYISILQRHHAGLAPDHIYVTP
jgi:predicted O-linked N-acetylglucosamine transferase (SPINDLY family)